MKHSAQKVLVPSYWACSAHLFLYNTARTYQRISSFFTCEGLVFNGLISSVLPYRSVFDPDPFLLSAVPYGHIQHPLPSPFITSVSTSFQSSKVPPLPSPSSRILRCGRVVPSYPGHRLGRSPLTPHLACFTSFLFPSAVW